MKNIKEDMKRLADEKGIFHIFAIDHREVFTDALDEKLGHKANHVEVLAEKNRLMNSVSDMVSGFLIDPVYFVDEQKMKADLKGKSFMMGIENNNYDVTKIDDAYLYENISVRQMKELGCAMVKLFVFYNPYMEFRKKIYSIVEYVAKECETYEIPFLLEPIMYSDIPLSTNERFSMMQETLEQLKEIPVDIYKLEFPGDVDLCSEEKNIELCKKISDQLNVPWIVLSAGVNADIFEKQIELAGRGGCSGYAVGRSVWKNYIACSTEKMNEMNDILSRFKKSAETYCMNFEKK